MYYTTQCLNPAAFSLSPVMGDATVPSATSLPRTETCVNTNCTMSAETERHVHSMETVWTDISGYFTVSSRSDLMQSYHKQMHILK